MGMVTTPVGGSARDSPWRVGLGVRAELRVHATMSDPVLHIVDVTVSTPGISFEEFFEREKTGLFGALCLVTRDRHQAEELSQDAFLAVYERWDRVAVMENPSGYLYRIAMNAFRSWNRRATMAARRTVGLAAASDPIGEIEAHDAVLRVLAPLTERQRAAVVLVDLLGYPSDEAGRILGIRAATVRTHVSRAHAELRSSAGEGR
jgi:RNA polymerase sigma factor (sigma-70 family)